MTMSPSEWKVPPGAQPKQADYGFDLDRALSSVLALSALVPSDAFTAETLGTERAGNAVVIRQSGLVLTVGYLVTEASSVWLTQGDGRVVPGHVLGIDAESGFGLVQALDSLTAPAMQLGMSAATRIGDPVVIGGAGGRRRSVAGRIAMKQEFAGYWEYLLDEAIFTGPAHPHWGGTALIGSRGELLGIGSLQLQQERGAASENLNMIIPIDLLKPVLDDILRTGRSSRPARPWLGVFCTEIEGKVVVAGTATGGPADKAGLETGDVVVQVAGREVSDLASFFRGMWSLGESGSLVPLRLQREGRVLETAIRSVDRASLLKKPALH